MRCFVTFKKAPIVGAFFILCVLTACEKTELEIDQTTHQLQYVVDGDTIVIDDGLKVRLVGINTPEMGYGNRKQEPFAKQAKNHLKALLGRGEVRLVFDKEQQDKNGRQLAYVFSKKGQDAQIELLENGLAFAVAVGENQSRLEAYLSAESKARENKTGIWGDDYYQPEQAKDIIKQRAKGYYRVTGKVTKTSKSNKHISLHLDDNFKVFIPKQFWKKHFKGKANQFLNKHITVRGWVFTLGSDNLDSISGVKVYHPSMIE